jgi:hypothetical protein
MLPSPSKPFLASALLAAVLLAGCSGGGGGGDGGDGGLGTVGEVEATATTGGIRGFVVDQKIVPIKGASVTVVPGDRSAETDEGGAFVFSGLEPGTYFVKASHPLHETQQQSVEVVAGVSDPAPVKFQLVRVISQDPYYVTLKFEGYIVCSINTAGALSEECGEGAGVPCQAPPPYGCQRLGGQDNNLIQFDFQVEPGAAGIVFETVWEPTSEAGKELYVPVGTNWVCDPGCSWDDVTEMQGASPLHAQIGPEEIESKGIVPGVNVTMFVWAGSFEEPAGVTLNQPFTDFATIFYYIPPPDGWSFVRGDAPPY